MKQFITLIKREFWEHKVGSFYTPLIIAFGFILLILFANVRSLSGISALKGLSLGMSFGSMPSILLFIVPVIIISYAMNSLYEERKNKSLLFWRSMPVSDTKTVLSKVCFGVLVIPILFIITWLLIVGVSIVLNSIVGGEMPPTFLLGMILCVSVGFLTLSVMMLPYYAYLTFVSSISNRSPILIAILPFIVLGFINMLIPESVIIYHYLLMPLELAMRIALEVTRHIAEWTGVLDHLTTLSEYQDFINHGFSSIETTTKDNVTIERTIEVDSVAFRGGIREFWILLGSIASSIGFITLAIFARQRVQNV